MTDVTGTAVKTEYVLPAECCLSCRFYLMDSGICRRYPPTVVGGVSDKKTLKGADCHIEWSHAFPKMHPQGWCGEWSWRLDA